jgi:hypothetical protein
MGPIFQINEELKEQCVNWFNAHKAITKYHKGSHYINEPFLETEIHWPSSSAFRNLSVEQVEDFGDLIFKAKKQIDELGGQMTEHLFELQNSKPVLVWAQFMPKEDKSKT